MGKCALIIPSIYEKAAAKPTKLPVRGSRCSRRDNGGSFATAAVVQVQSNRKEAKESAASP
jgi:hypothetical protein